MGESIQWINKQDDITKAVMSWQLLWTKYIIISYIKCGCCILLHQNQRTTLRSWPPILQVKVKFVTTVIYCCSNTVRWLYTVLPDLHLVSVIVEPKKKKKIQKTTQCHLISEFPFTNPGDTDISVFYFSIGCCLRVSRKRSSSNGNLRTRHSSLCCTLSNHHLLQALTPQMCQIKIK